MTNTWIALTRPGFEETLGREFSGARVSTRSGSGWLKLRVDEEEGRKPWKDLDPRRFIFARVLMLTIAEVKGAPREGLAERIAAAALEWRKSARLATGFHSMVVEAPDDEGGRKLLTRLDGLDEEVADELRRLGLVSRRRSGLPRLHLFFPDEESVFLGLSDPVVGSPWPMGAPRIELPADAPSRSARKIEEAILTFIPAHEMEGRLTAGMRAVDLGAAPGGWSWQLMRRGLVVDAVDNGDLAKSVFEMGLVTHHRADGYTYRPQWPVDWLFCDMVGGALRIARLVANWVKRGHFREAIFNLKLGDGDKLKQVQDARRLLLGVARDAGAKVELSFKHLYHDRDEVTAHLRIIERNEELARPGQPKRPVKGGEGRRKPQAEPPTAKAPPKARAQRRGAKAEGKASASPGSKESTPGGRGRRGASRNAAQPKAGRKPR